MMSFFPIVDIMYPYRDIFGQSSKSVPKSVYPSPWGFGGVNARETSDQIFQISVISEYMSKCG